MMKLRHEPHTGGNPWITVGVVGVTTANKAAISSRRTSDMSAPYGYLPTDGH